MRIQGLQKLTLLDFPGKVACTVFTAGCNFRCPFCHNATLVLNPSKEADLTEEAFFSFLKKRRGVLEGVCITGGEPLLQLDIREFIERIKSMGYAVKLDTNGSFPEKMIWLVEHHLIDYVAMDIKNTPETYALTAGIDALDMESVMRSVSYLKEGHVPYEFRTTVLKHYHCSESFEKIGQWIHGAEKYALQKFVDSGDLIGKQIRGCSEAEMREFLQIARKYIPNAELRGL